MTVTTIHLDAPYVAQHELEYDTAVVLQNQDDPVNGSLKSLVELGGNKSLHYWVPVYPDTGVYNPNWTDADVATAVKAWFVANPISDK